MSLGHCADLVEQGDPDRFLVARGAGPEARARLLPVYALNIEIGRAAWASDQPLVAEMRLQWWQDALEDLARGAVRAHPVLEACGFLAGDGEGVALAQGLVEARRRDVWREGIADQPALWAHLAATGGGLMQLAARVLGGGEAVAHGFGTGTALAGWLLAVPGLRARGIAPLPEGVPVADLARAGLAWIAAARARRGEVARAAVPALLAGWQAAPLLAQAVAEPGRVEAGTLGLSEFSRRGRLAWAAATGRW